MSNSIRYSAEPARQSISDAHWDGLSASLEAARKEVFSDVELFNSGGAVPEEKQPLDAGFIELPRRLLNDYEQNGEESLVGQILATAQVLREELDRLVVLGIGGSYMGMRALFEGLCDPFHNELPRPMRGDVPRLYFEGNNVDNDALQSLLMLLGTQCADPTDFAQRWGIVVISKSGGTLETAVSFRLFREALEEYYGESNRESTRYVVPITGESGKLRDFSNERGYPATFPIPDGVGGRFSIFTAVGLLPAAVMGMDILRLLEGAADITDNFRDADRGDNPVMDYTAVCHLLEKHSGLKTRIMSTWGKKMEASGLWYDQLLAESLGKNEQGALPLTIVNTRDLHSRGQQHQEGVRDKLITNVIIEKPDGDPISIPELAENRNQDQLNKFAGKTIPEVLDAAIKGTNQAYADVNRPTADIIIPELDAYALGQFYQMLMLATVLEGRLIGINPYGQPGVEAYKQNMNAILSGK
ncbi:glucose-6-phosphate isomerase [Rubinisphaera sp. JC750]|uniref:glucose-6-phosphate isomerase n=1 Tax=Rubinisphaera sp. JC750 TaxID=2898658 RepID=UPI001F308FD1|nr:glucose-6-phosphate isomerase [Rubinisphaera sp. JC750]